MSHPLIETAPGLQLPVTICALAYGAHSHLAERFLSSLYQHTDPTLFHLRAGLNEVEPWTRWLFRDYSKRFGNITLFEERVNIFKCPLMRRLFHQPAIDTGWTVWCDDDTYFTRADWLHRLALKVERNPKVAMWGRIYLMRPRNQAIHDHIRTATWYRGVPMLQELDANGVENTEFRFVTGGFWAIRTCVIRQLNWPEPRLIQAYDDILLTEALRQNDLGIGEFGHGVMINAATRRNSNGIPVFKGPDACESVESGANLQ